MRGIARGVAWAVGGPLVAVMVLYGVLVLVNWRDEPPSDVVRRFEASERARAPVDDGANAYVYVMGFTAAPGEDPVALGARRQAAIVAGGPDPMPVRRDHDSSPDRVAPQAMGLPCGESVLDCESALRQHERHIEQWLSDDALSLERYAALLDRDQWREPLLRDISTPLPQYREVYGAQQLYLLATRQLAREGDAMAVRDRLGADMAFWRGVLASSDLLITKMIAASAIRRNLVFGTAALRALPDDRRAGAMPASWTRPLSLQERSMSRVFAGEWRFADAAIRHGVPGCFDARPESDEATFDARIASCLTAPLYLPQATSNRYAEMVAELGAASERPYARMGEELDRLHVEWIGRTRLIRLRNPVGNVLTAIGAGNGLRDYVVRVADLEGMRRATVLAHRLRSHPSDEPASAIRMSDLRDPYLDTPLDWDAKDRAVRFAGQQRAPRGRYAVPL